MTQHLQTEALTMFQPPSSSSPPTSVSSTFRFNSTLDSSFLNNFYQEDLQDASLRFEVFLSFTVSNFQKLVFESRRGNWQKVKYLAHKIKPSFDIVGLTRLSEQLLNIETAYFSIAELPKVIASMQDDFQQKLPAVVAQKMSIDNFLQGLGN